MKKDIHPKYNEIKVKCLCGAEHQIGSTMSEMKIEICSSCHPFFTGKEKTLDTAGRVDKFKKRVDAAKK
jgi:large subunit ribosomal protein L31